MAWKMTKELAEIYIEKILSRAKVKNREFGITQWPDKLPSSTYVEVKNNPSQYRSDTPFSPVNHSIWIYLVVRTGNINGRISRSFFDIGEDIQVVSIHIIASGASLEEAVKSLAAYYKITNLDYVTEMVKTEYNKRKNGSIMLKSMGIAPFNLNDTIKETGIKVKKPNLAFDDMTSSNVVKTRKVSNK